MGLVQRIPLAEGASWLLLEKVSLVSHSGHNYLCDSGYISLSIAQSFILPPNKASLNVLKWPPFILGSIIVSSQVYFLIFYLIHLDIFWATLLLMLSSLIILTYESYPDFFLTTIYVPLL